ncbi:MAG: hypothetical protein ACYS0D_04325, partial [Planctomycetota bacterium]
MCALSLGAAGPGLPGGYRISDQGPPGDPAFGAGTPAVAYNGTADEFLVVWRGDDDIDGEPEIYCQRIDAATGAEIRPDDLKISAMGSGLGGTWPSVVYNPAADEYLVVWSGTKDEEIGVGVYVQRLDAQGGEIGANDQRINAVSCETPQPKVAYSSVADEYLVVWNGCGHVFGQRLDATGAQIDDDFRVDEGAANAGNATVTYNDLAAEYLVVFQDASQLFVRRLDSAGEALSGEIAIANAELAASLGVAYDSSDNEYLVVWQSGDESLAAGGLEIFGQRLDASGTEIGADDFRISDMGVDGDPNVDARSSSVAYDPVANEYLVLWHGDDGTPPLGEGEFEIFGQHLDAATGAEIGPNDFRVSRMGP